jgi:hypothetical protein
MKRVLILGGAILVLAACDSATTAPISLHDGGAASVKKAPTSPSGSGGYTTMSVCPGTWVRTGSDSTWMPDPGCTEEQ